MFKVFNDMETMKIMKAMKLLLIVFGLVSVLSLSAQTFAEQPVVQMHSTSAMMGSGSELPQAAVTGTYTTYSSGPSYAPRGPQRGAATGDTPPADPNGPMEEPLGDTPWVLMALLVAGYAVWVGKKYGVRMPGNNWLPVAGDREPKIRGNRRLAAGGQR